METHHDDTVYDLFHRECGGVVKADYHLIAGYQGDPPDVCCASYKCQQCLKRWTDCDNDDEDDVITNARRLLLSGGRLMPPILPSGMKNSKEVSDAALFNARQWVTILETRGTTAKGLMLQATALSELAKRLAEIEREENQASERRFPIIGEPYNKKEPYGTAPWSWAEKAYVEYSRLYGTDQSLERIAERGGFGYWEMDTYAPGWRDHFVATSR